MDRISRIESIALAAMDFVGAVILLIVFPVGAEMVLSGVLGVGR